MAAGSNLDLRRTYQASCFVVCCAPMTLAPGSASEIARPQASKRPQNISASSRPAWPSDSVHFSASSVPAARMVPALQSGGLKPRTLRVVAEQSDTGAAASLQLKAQEPPPTPPAPVTPPQCPCCEGAGFVACAVCLDDGRVWDWRPLGGLKNQAANWASLWGPDGRGVFPLRFERILCTMCEGAKMVPCPQCSPEAKAVEAERLLRRTLRKKRVVRRRVVYNDAIRPDASGDLLPSPQNVHWWENFNLHVVLPGPLYFLHALASTSTPEHEEMDVDGHEQLYHTLEHLEAELPHCKCASPTVN